MEDVKISDSLSAFRSNVKRYGTLTCHCNKCKNLFLVWVILIDLMVIKSFQNL